MFPSPEKSWDFPKFYHVRKYPGDIRRFGLTDMTTTGPKEAGVKHLRVAYGKTNKQNDTVNQQVAAKVDVHSAAQAATASTQQDKGTTGAVCVLWRAPVQRTPLPFTPRLGHGLTLSSRLISFAVPLVHVAHGDSAC